MAPTARLEEWRLWVEGSNALATEILERRGGEPLDVDAVWSAARAGQIPEAAGERRLTERTLAGDEDAFRHLFVSLQ